MWILGKHRHLSDERLSEYVSGRLSADERARTERVLASCDACREELLTWELSRDALHGLPTIEMPRSFVMAQAPAPSEALAAGAATSAILDLFRLPRLSPWVYAGAASLAALAVALVVTTQGGLPWTGAALETMSGEGAATAMQMDAPPQAAMALDKEVPVETSAEMSAAPAKAEAESVSRPVPRTSLPVARQRQDEAVPAPAAAPQTALQETSRENFPEAVAVPAGIDSVKPTEQPVVPAEPTPAPQIAAMTEQAQPETAAEPPAVPAAAPPKGPVDSVEAAAQLAQASPTATPAAASAGGQDAPAQDSATRAAGAPAPRGSSGYAIDAAHTPTPATASAPSSLATAPTLATAAAQGKESTAAEGETGKPADAAATPSPVALAEARAEEGEAGAVGGAAGTSVEGSDQTGTGLAVVPQPAEVSTRESTGPSAGETVAADPEEEKAGREVVASQVSPVEPEKGGAQVDAAADGTALPAEGSGDGSTPGTPSEAAGTPPAIPGLAVPRDIMPTFQAKEAARIQKARKTERPLGASEGADGAAAGDGTASPAQASSVYVLLWLVAGILAAAVLAVAAYLGLRIRRSRESGRT